MGTKYAYKNECLVNKRGKERDKGQIDGLVNEGKEERRKDEVGGRKEERKVDFFRRTKTKIQKKSRCKRRELY